MFWVVEIVLVVIVSLQVLTLIVVRERFLLQHEVTVALVVSSLNFVLAKQYFLHHGSTLEELFNGFVKSVTSGSRSIATDASPPSSSSASKSFSTRSFFTGIHFCIVSFSIVCFSGVTFSGVLTISNLSGPTGIVLIRFSSSCFCSSSSSLFLFLSASSFSHCSVLTYHFGFSSLLASRILSILIPNSCNKYSALST